MTDPPLVDASNTEQLRAWDGDEGAYWAAHAARFDRSAASYHARLLPAAAITPEERVLDIGCGTGQAARDAARAAPQGAAVGIDLSSRMLEVARRLAADEGVANVSFVQADAQVHPFPQRAFTLALSRFGSMFFSDLVGAFANIGRALVPGGRLALVTWQPPPRNEWLREIAGALAAGREVPAPRPDAPGPFALSDPDRVRAVLTAAGFTDVELEGVTAGMCFGDDAHDAQRFVLGLMGWMVEPLDPEARARAVGDLLATMAAHETADGVVLGSAAWVITATRA